MGLLKQSEQIEQVKNQLNYQLFNICYLNYSNKFYIISKIVLIWMISRKESMSEYLGLKKFF
jgi:hypothetical protein